MNNITQNTKITSTDINALISELNGKLNLSGGDLTGRIRFKMDTDVSVKPSSTFYSDGIRYIDKNNKTLFILGYSQNPSINSHSIRFLPYSSDNKELPNLELTSYEDNTSRFTINSSLNVTGNIISKLTFSSERIIEGVNPNTGTFWVSEKELSSTQTSSIALFPTTIETENRKGAFEIKAGNGTSTKTLTGHYTNGLSWDGDFKVSHTSSPNITVNNSSGGEASIIIDRGTRSGWKFKNPNGNFILQNNWTTERGDWFDVLTINYNTGNATFKGTVKAEQYLFNNGAKLWIA